ncbi:MAG TPA: NmrA/HSCARG family protein [Vicinamibacterales bacterium]|nr:NmrA/HSCARG family protein [Vicinamibacterales bacterium]
MSSRIIAVVGAAGSQGGSVARAILADDDRAFSLRALTRRPQSERAQALARLGAEVVYADVDDLESLKAAFAGAYGAYCMTDFWGGSGDPERERMQGETMAEAAKAAALEHVIWSTLEDTRRFIPLSDTRMPTLLGKYKVPHFDGKGEADAAFVRSGVPTTFYLTSFYWDNLLNFPGMGLRKDAGGELLLAMPLGDKRLPGIAVEDIGGCALGIFKDEHAKDVTIGVAGEHLTGAQMADGLARAIGRPVRYVDVDPAIYRTWDFPAAAELSNMLQFKRDFQHVFCGSRSVDRSKQLNPRLQSFDDWLLRHRAALGRAF